jgi:hypothetical protein
MFCMFVLNFVNDLFLLLYNILIVTLCIFIKRNEVTGERRELHHEELHDLYSSPNIVRMIKSRRMRWAGQCSAYGEEERRV